MPLKAAVGAMLGPWLPTPQAWNLYRGLAVSKVAVRATLTSLNTLTLVEASRNGLLIPLKAVELGLLRKPFKSGQPTVLATPMSSIVRPAPRGTTTEILGFDLETNPAIIPAFSPGPHWRFGLGPIPTPKILTAKQLKSDSASGFGPSERVPISELELELKFGNVIWIVWVCGSDRFRLHAL